MFQTTNQEKAHTEPRTIPTYIELEKVLGKTLMSKGTPLKLAPRGRTPRLVDTECGALKKTYKMDGHQEFTLIQNGRAPSKTLMPRKAIAFCRTQIFTKKISSPKISYTPEGSETLRNMPFIIL